VPVSLYVHRSRTDRHPQYISLHIATSLLPF
jgi:hypothetical protein